MTLRNLDRWVRSLRDQVAGLEVPQELEERFGRYRDDPVGFVREVLGAESATRRSDGTPYQSEILEACAAHARVAWASGHGAGKSTTLAWLLLWFLLTRPFSRVLILAPAYERQVGRYLLPEVRKWVRQAPEPLPVDVRANVVEVVGFEREWFAIGVQASDPSKVEGGHAASLCVLADEAKGLDADVVAALHGTQTDIAGDRLYVLASVPGGPSGPFYDAFRKGVWKTFTVSSAESSLVSESWVEERAAEWGEASPLYQARVLGQFPEEEEGTLFRLSDLEAAVERELETEGRYRLGVDVARFGSDRSAIAVWRGATLLEIQSRGGLDVMDVAAWVASLANRLSDEDGNAPRIRVDEIGIGSGVVDRLRQLGHTVEAVNVGRAASKPELFANLRAEVFWRLREALERGTVSLPRHDGLLAELSAIRYGYTPSGQIRLEKKDQTKKRVGHSPDLADACALGFAVPPERCPLAYVGGRVVNLDTGEVESGPILTPDDDDWWPVWSNG